MVDLKAAAIAANRFGFGPRPGELPTIGRDPRGWLEAQLKSPPGGDPAASARESQARLTELLKAREEHKDDVELGKMLRNEARTHFKTEAAARTLAAAASPTPFLERLVQFWSNHFTVSIQRPPVTPIAVGYETEAIRPHVLSRFADMLHAVAQHPAMLLYLDNAISIGPNSKPGRNLGKGLNENLAREVLELHTVGVDGGYTQTDVTEFAKILTGWSIGRHQDQKPGAFEYRDRMHEPGDKTLLGKRYAEAGLDEGTRALDDLAARPQTAHHIATKLARHFIADQPPPAAVDKLTSVFLRTGGDLHAVSLALIDLPEIWTAPFTKVKTPNDLVISTYRSFGLDDPDLGDGAIAALKQMGQMPFNAPSPAGWPDNAASWISPESVMTRVDWASAAGRKLDGHADARQVARGTIQPVASERTLAHIANAPSTADALALLIACPEFQRR